ncbi:MAG: hypothetical protein AB1861_28800 [Cyanobacteriota bacterium]
MLDIIAIASSSPKRARSLLGFIAQNAWIPQILNTSLPTCTEQPQTLYYALCPSNRTTGCEASPKRALHSR